MNFKTCLVAAALACVSTFANADLVTFDFSSSGTFTGGSSSNSFGNSVTYLGSDGITNVTVTAFSMTQGTSGFLNQGAPYAIQSASVTQTSNGLGVCNRREYALGGISNTCNPLTGAGAADNLGFDEFLLFSFSRKVNTTKIRLKPTENAPNLLVLADSDAATYEFDSAISPIGQLFPSLAIGPKSTSSANPGDLPRDINDAIPDTQFSYLIIAADPSDVGLVEDDIFRVGSITGVPLPGTLALMGIAGLAAFGASRKRAA